jgi:hypothetical protein
VKTYERWADKPARKVHLVVNGESLCENADRRWFTSANRPRTTVTRRDFKLNGCRHCKWAAGTSYVA